MYVNDCNFIMVQLESSKAVPVHVRPISKCIARPSSSSASSSLLLTAVLPVLLTIATIPAPVSAAGADDDGDGALDGDDDLEGKPFDFLGLVVLVGAMVGLACGAWKIAGRGDMFGEGNYLAEQERLAREEAARQAEEEKAKETEFGRG
mmetsp:Transcript_6111/g.12771  ORF Transcript_6111/g.12771 Transcript_6111/m.12771 type:complete len:149 (+) Transcript_6111:90-536(+)